MKHILLRAVLTLLVLIPVSSCIDKNYDLSDIDTTSQLKVKDLVVPLNIDVITLGDIFNVKENDDIQEVSLNGNKFYAIHKKGTFHSDKFVIPSFTSPAPNLLLDIINYHTGITSQTIGNRLTLPMTQPIENDLIYKAEGIDSSIVTLDDIYTDRLTFTILFNALNLPSGINASLDEISILLPKGLTLDSSDIDFIYNPSTGRLSIKSLPLVNGEARLSISVNTVNLPANGCRISNQSFTFSSCLNIERANLIVEPVSSNETIPSDIRLQASYILSDMVVRALTGDIEYYFDGNGIAIPSIDLSVLPDFIAGTGTNLILANPQVYLSVNNPLTALGLDWTSGFQVTAVRTAQPSKSYGLDYGHIGVDHSKPLGERYNYRLSPDLEKDQILIPTGYENPEHVMFSGLREVLSGEGLPDQLDLKFVDPKIFRQHIDKLLLDTEFPALEGNWELIAPLALTNLDDNRSQIIYSKTDKGWHDTRLYDMTIETLELTMKVDNDLPLEATLNGYPIDITGQQIGNVSIEGAVVPANAKDQEVKLYITGEVKKLDGITFTAFVYPDSDKPLSSSQTLRLKEIKAKVSGYYIKKL